jgi:hypothetical protein
MPRTNIDYSKTIIYKIVCNDLNITDIYVGHTTDFTRRKLSHKSSCNNINDKKYYLTIYEAIRKNGGWGNWSMIEIEKYPCIDANEARKKERVWFEELNAKLNMIFPQRTDEEYRNDNKEKVKNYRKENIDHIHEVGRIYHQQHKEKRNSYSEVYRTNNKEKIKQLSVDYYEKIKDKLKEKLTCECGAIISRVYITKHCKTKAHIKYLETKEI